MNASLSWVLGFLPYQLTDSIADRLLLYCNASKKKYCWICIFCWALIFVDFVSQLVEPCDQVLISITSKCLA